MKKTVLLFIAVLGLSPCAWADYPEDAVDKREVVRMLKADRFAELDTLFLKLQSEFEKGQANELKITYAFRSFDNSDPELKGHIQRWIEKTPDSFAAHHALGEYHEGLAWKSRGGKVMRDTSGYQVSGMMVHFKIAYDEFMQALKLKPGLIPAYVSLIRIGNGIGNDVLESEAMERGLEIDPANYLIHYQYLFSQQPKWGGSFHAIEAHLKRTRPYYDQNPRLKALEGFPHFVRANHLRFSRTGDLQAAEREIDAALAFGDNAMYHWEKGDIYCGLGDSAKAVESYSEALRQRPQEAMILDARGWCYARMGDNGRALKDYDAAIELDALASDTLRQRGLILYSKGQVEDARQDLEASLIYGDSNMTAHQYLGYIYYNQKNFIKAEEHFGKSIRLGNEHPQDMFFLAASQWSNENCAFVATARAYLEMCRTKDGCNESNKRWAEANPAYAIRKGICK